MQFSARAYPMPDDELSRLRELLSYDVLDTPPDADLDRLVRLASRLFKSSISLVSLVDDERQFFKARFGLDASQTPRDMSFCSHAVVDCEMLVVNDALADARFATNPLVTGHPGIRFYAGAPLITPSGRGIGTLCVIDDAPRASFTDEDRALLRDVADLVMDRLEMRRLDAAARISRHRFQGIAGTSPDAIVCADAGGVIRFWNGAAERIFGYSADEAVGMRFTSMVRGTAEGQQVLSTRTDDADDIRWRTRSAEFIGTRKNGETFPLELSTSSWGEGISLTYGAIGRDVSERRDNEARLFRLARIDALTELANRDTFQRVLEQRIEDRLPTDLLMLDLDGFGDINDLLGHVAGDAVLRTVAQRLAESFSDARLVARMGGDEFGILLDPTTSGASIVARIQAAIELVAKPIAVERTEVSVCISVGRAQYPADAASGKALLSNAVLALSQAKRQGRNAQHFFVPELREMVATRKRLEDELARAHRNGEFELFYQPQIDLAAGRLIGAEALLRWNHPQRGLLAPVEFLDVLEAGPDAADVGAWILDTACMQAAQWRKARNADFRVAVNLFGLQLKHIRLAEQVAGALERAGLPASSLDLEITENTLINDTGLVLSSLRSLRQAGVGIAFDDYGTGYASLSLLKRLPITRLKVDRSFVSNVVSDPEDAAVVQAILYLGRSFGLKVVAEGVETAAQEDFLRAIGCDEVQGYRYGRAVAAEAFPIQQVHWAA